MQLYAFFMLHLSCLKTNDFLRSLLVISLKLIFMCRGILGTQSFETNAAALVFFKKLSELSVSLHMIVRSSQTQKELCLFVQASVHFRHILISHDSFVR